MNDRVGLEDARAAKPKALEVFSSLVDEVAVGIVSLGKGHYGLKINLKAPPDDDISMPTEIDGIPVQVEIVGTIRKR